MIRTIKSKVNTLWLAVDTFFLDVMDAIWDALPPYKPSAALSRESESVDEVNETISAGLRRLSDWVGTNAYFRWLNGGCQEGKSLEYWLAAEEEYDYLSILTACGHCFCEDCLAEREHDDDEDEETFGSVYNLPDW